MREGAAVPASTISCFPTRLWSQKRSFPSAALLLALPCHFRSLLVAISDLGPEFAPPIGCKDGFSAVSPTVPDIVSAGLHAHASDFHAVR